MSWTRSQKPAILCFAILAALPGQMSGGPVGRNVEYVISDTRIEAFNSMGLFLFQFGGTGSGPGQFQLPSGITVDSVGNVWVTDASLNRVQKFNAAGTFLFGFGSTGVAPGFLYRPYGVAVDPTGNVWIADTGNNRIEEFSPAGAFLQQVGGLGGGDGQFNAPVGIVIGPGGNPANFSIFVSDTGNNRIQQFVAFGSSPGFPATVTFSEKTLATDHLNGPFELALDTLGVWVADSGNQRVLAYDFGPPPPIPHSAFSGVFSYPSPYGVATDLTTACPTNPAVICPTVWAVDYNLNKVFAIQQGAVVLQFGVTGGGPGQLNHPTFIAVSTLPPG